MSAEIHARLQPHVLALNAAQNNVSCAICKTFIGGSLRDNQLLDDFAAHLAEVASEIEDDEPLRKILQQAYRAGFNDHERGRTYDPKYGAFVVGDDE